MIFGAGCNRKYLEAERNKFLCNRCSVVGSAAGTVECAFEAL